MVSGAGDVAVPLLGTKLRVPRSQGGVVERQRLLHALSLSVQRHEAVFGVLETDIQKRLKPQQRS